MMIVTLVNLVPQLQQANALLRRNPSEENRLLVSKAQCAIDTFIDGLKQEAPSRTHWKPANE